MRLRKTLSFTFAFLVTAGGLVFASTSGSAQTGSPATVASAGSWIDAGDGPNGVIPVELDNGTIAELPTGTRFRMICWYSRVTHKRFYGEITSGRHKGHYTNIQSDAVRDQTSVPHCD